MRTAAFALALLATVSAAAMACGPEAETVRLANGNEFRVPAGSPVHFQAEGEAGVARFAGTFPLSGTYRYGYVTDDPENDATYGVAQLDFVPDAESAARLPRWSNESTVGVIWIRNEPAFLAAVVPADTLAALQRGELRSVTGKVRIVAEAYSTSVDCDSGTYSLEFVALQGTGEALASRDLRVSHGC